MNIQDSCARRTGVAWRLLLVALSLALVLSEVALAQASDDVRKLDHTARALVRAEADGRLAAEAFVRAPMADIRLLPGGEVSVGVLVRLLGTEGIAALESAGMLVQTIAGDVAVGHIRAGLLARLAAVEYVESVEIGSLLEPLNDLGGDAINLPLVHAGTGLPQPYRGDGVVVGIVDTGIDFTHPDFSDADGTRIEYLLELLPDDDNQPPTAQIEWSKAEIDATPDLVTQRDIHGHGTHVTGTAAGGGVENPAFVGAAPESRLVIVKASRTGSVPGRPHVFREVDMINAVAYIFDRAADLGMPAVVNLSIGRPGGPLDGSETGLVAMSNLAGEGRVIVFGGGNDGSRTIHWSADLEPDQRALMAINYSGFETGALGQYAHVNAWYDPGAVSTVTLSAREPGAMLELASITLSTGEAHAEPVPIEGPQGTLGYGLIDASITAHPVNGLGIFDVVVTSLNDPVVNIDEVVWSVGVAGGDGGRVDAWIAPAMGAFRTQWPHDDARFIPGDTYLTLNRWAAAHRVIAAGAFTSRNQWVNAHGDTITAMFGGQPYEVGRRTHFSARGPTRDGRVRPDLLAPGAFIASALSSHVSAYGGTLYGETKYVVGQGTSFAAPFVTGTSALLLQVEAALTDQDVRWLLRNSAKQEPEMGTLPNPSYGYGKLDAFAAVQEALTNIGTGAHSPGVAQLVLEAPFPNPTRSSATITFSLSAAGAVTLEAYDLLGRHVRSLVDERLNAGPHRVIFDREELASGIYVVVLRSAGAMRARRVVVID